MAITKLLSPNTPNPITAGPNGDWDLAMAQLTAVKKLLAGEQMMLTEWTNATTQPKLALGTHLQHKGSIYVVDTEDYALPALGGNGTYYIVLEPSGSSLVGSWVTSLGGYTWDATYNGLYNGDKLVLPYQIVVDGSDIVKRKILNPWIDGGFTTVDWMGNVRGASLVVNGNTTVGGALGVTGAINGASLGVTGAISGASVGVSGAITALEAITTNGPNKPVDNNDASMPSVGIGGFSYAVGSKSGSGFPSITIGSGGTWVYIAYSTRSDNDTTYVKLGRISGGSGVQGLILAGSGVTASVYVIAWRIA